MTKLAEWYACLYAREFPVQALLRLRPEMRSRPCAVIEGPPPFERVCSMNAKARHLGVARGMTQAEMETFASCAVLARSLQEEATAKAALLECAGAFSPRVEEQSGDGAFLCVLDIAGTEKLFGPPQKLAAALLERVRTLGIEACTALSGNFHAAVCLARGMASGAGIQVVAAASQRAALSALPLNVLELPEELAETFSLWGISTLGLLAEMPEKGLIARLGQEGQRLQMLARGELPHLFLPIEPVFMLQESMEFEGPVESLDSLLFAAGVMLDQLILRAGARMLAPASLTIHLCLEGGGSHARTVRSALPASDRRLWLKLLHLDLQAHPPSAAIVSLSITADPGQTSKVQLGLFSPQLPEPGRLDITLARIRAIVGEDCVGRAVLEDMHHPDGFRMEPFSLPSKSSGANACSAAHIALRQLRPAERISVTSQGERPAAFRFREKRFAVERAYGPWLTDGGWWGPLHWSFEQWDMVARAPDGARLCCCLVRDPAHNQWRMVALYD